MSATCTTEEGSHLWGRGREGGREGGRREEVKRASKRESSSSSATMPCLLATAEVGQHLALEHSPLQLTLAPGLCVCVWGGGEGRGGEKWCKMLT